MKHLSYIFLVLAIICSTSHLYAQEYIHLSPLNTQDLPKIPPKDCGGNLVRNVMNGDAMWKHSHQKLVKSHFSQKVFIRMMKTLYHNTKNHMVGIRCSYWSQTPQGDSLLVSGKIYLPKNRELKGLLIANHYTIATDIEAPSNIFQMDCIYAMKGYAVIMPDYVGYGVSKQEVHPYLHWPNAAHTAVDLLNCMPPLLNYYGYTYPTDVTIVGYSQGGAVALGVARLLEQTSSTVSTPWTIRKLYAGAGPYDPAATYDYCVEHDSIGIPGAIPMIVMGLSDAYDLNFQLSDFFQEPLLSHYDEWVTSKQYSVSQIGQMMGSGRMSKLMQAAALDKNNYLTQQLYHALKLNSNVGYSLQAPAYFMHSTEDAVVPIINSYNLQTAMPDTTRVRFDFAPYGSHMEAALPFMQYVYQDL